MVVGWVLALQAALAARQGAAAVRGLARVLGAAAMMEAVVEGEMRGGAVSLQAAARTSVSEWQRLVHIYVCVHTYIHTCTYILMGCVCIDR